MISVKIEKEIKGENKIIGNFTLRQALCFAFDLIVLGIVYFFLKPTEDVIILIGGALGFGTWYIAFHKKNGMPSEYFLIKKIKEKVLKNTDRAYKTKNKYITMLNAGYLRDRNADLSDKKTAKIVKKNMKKEAKNKKVSKLKVYA